MLRKVKRYLDEVQFDNESKIFRKLEKYEYVSFDIFDTLIKRDVSKPIDVFEVLERKTGNSGFAQRRVQAEQNARRHSMKEDVSLEEIYAFLETDVEFMRLECELEINLCTKNLEIEPIYQWCLDNNKKIIIISDMYLDYDTIEKILSKNGICDYERLFISNLENKTKQSGNLYHQVAEQLEVSPSQIIHVGNSFVADYYNAKKVGYGTVKVRTNNSRMQQDYREICVGEMNFQTRCLESFINNHVSGKSFEYRFGYENFGPALVGFSKWVLREMQIQKRDLALFLGRDGLIMKQTYDALGFDQIIPSEYIEVSRRSFRIPSLSTEMEFDEIAEDLPLRAITTINEFIECLGLEPSGCFWALQKLQLKGTDAYLRNEMLSDARVRELYGLLKKDIVSNALEEKKFLKAYLETFSFDKKIGLIDVGWGGTIQYHLETLLKEWGIHSDILGYYWGLAERAREVIGRLEGSSEILKAKGYFVDCLCGRDRLNYHRPFDGFFETLFLQQVGSVKKYKIEGEHIEIERLPYEYENDPTSKEKVYQIQAGAKQFVENFKCSEIFCIMDGSKEVMFANLERACTNPTKEELKCFQNIHFYDSGNMKKLYENYNWFYLLVHPKKFVYGYHEAFWKVGYLKNIMKVQLPYMDICLKLFPWVANLGFRIKRRLKKMVGLEKDEGFIYK